MKIFAHRGVARAGADENSLEAFRRAVEMGIDGIELDIRLTKDGKPVVAHDADLRRIAGDNRRIGQVTLRELREITLRHGAGVPALDEVTACVPAPVIIDFEVKDARVLDLVIRKLKTSRGLRERSFISSFKRGVIERAGRELPEVPRIVLLRRWPVRLGRFASWIRTHGIWGAGQSCTALSESRVIWLKRHGLQAVTWEPYSLGTSRLRARRLQKIGVDVAIVNRPQLYREALGNGQGAMGRPALRTLRSEAACPERSEGTKGTNGGNRSLMGIRAK
jgi:glycerophosphoryl diester phosphodiesterase